MTLEELCEVGYDLAARVLLKTRDELLSSFTLVKSDNSVDIIHCPWENDTEKKKMVLAIGHSIISLKEEVLAYSLLTECWTSSYKHFNAPRRAERPEFDPQRQEAVLCFASDGENHTVRSWAIGRDSEGRCTSLAAAKQDGQFESWMVEAMDRAVLLQRAKFKIVNEFREKGDVDVTGLPPKIQEAIKNFIHESKSRHARGDKGGG